MRSVDRAAAWRNLSGVVRLRDNAERAGRRAGRYVGTDGLRGVGDGRAVDIDLFGRAETLAFGYRLDGGIRVNGLDEFTFVNGKRYKQHFGFSPYFSLTR